MRIFRLNFRFWSALLKLLCLIYVHSTFFKIFHILLKLDCFVLKISTNICWTFYASWSFLNFGFKFWSRPFRWAQICRVRWQFIFLILFLGDFLFYSTNSGFWRIWKFMLFYVFIQSWFDCWVFWDFRRQRWCFSSGSDYRWLLYGLFLVNIFCDFWVQSSFIWMFKFIKDRIPFLSLFFMMMR